MTRSKLTAVLVGAALVAAATSCYADKLAIGEKAPKWSNLPGIDGKQHSLSDYADAKLIVLVFTCNHCPVAAAYEDRLVELQRDYKAKGVQVIAVNVNTMPADRLDKMKQRAEEKDFNFPYLYDESQQIGRDYGATCTPHVFVLDQNRKIAYMGAIDDSQNPKKVKEPYLRNAIDALLAGKQPPKATTRQFGCGIQYH